MKNIIFILFLLFLHSMNLSNLQAECSCYRTFGSTTTSSSDWSGSGIAGHGNVVDKNFCVNGRLNIDVDASFLNCYFYMSPGSSIWVTEGSTLKATSTHFMISCGTTSSASSSMWNGIVISDGAMDFNHNWIYDAITGINDEAGQLVIQFIQNTFDRCWEGFIANDIIPARPFVGNKFLCTGALLNTSIGNTGTPDEAMDIKGSQITEISCTYDNVRDGIQAESSTITCQNDNFSNLDNAMTFVDVYATITKCTIRSVINGIIEYDNSDINANGNKFTNLQDAIWKAPLFVKGQIPDRITIIKSNIMDTVQSYGIRIMNYTPSTNTDIDNNNITFGLTTYVPKNATLHEGIELDNGGSSRFAERRAKITNNHINLTYANNAPEFKGYELSNIENVKLNSNYATYSGASSHMERKGIVIKNCDLIKIMGNTLTGGAGYTPHAQGIVSTDMSNSFLCCNSLNSLDNGIRFSGANIASLVRGENFNGPFSSNSLFFEECTTMVPQLRPGNNWDGTADVDARYVGDPDEAVFSPFICTSSGYPNDPIIGPAGWFVLIGGDEPQCNDEPDCDYIPPINCNDYPYDTLILSHGYESEHGVGITWQARKNLLQALYRDPTLGCDSTLVEDFKSANESSALGKLAKLGNLISNLYQSSHELDSELLHLDTILQTEMRAIIIADSMFETEEVDLEYWEGIRAGHMEDYSDAYENYTELIDAHHESILDSIPSILSFLSGITPGNIRDTNDLFVSRFGLYHALYPEDTISNTEYAHLEYIADQCPLDGGDAVYRARSILSAIDPDYYNPGVSCSEMTGLRSKKQKDQNLESGSIKIWPNPSNGITNIKLPRSNENLQYNLTIINLEGKQIISKEIKSKGEILPIELKPGFYIIKIQNQINLNYLSKLLIQE